VIVTSPINMSLKDWADQVVIDLDSFGALIKLQDEVHWQDWAAQFLLNARIGLTPPDPYSFSDWRDWAERFCGTVS
jgi:hypothetical protein